ncbi:MAG TPA: hypothetical protein VLB44_22980, partial [Kofleriaceae bacterium]|nr:hypothetical protein [Kofleriaceae bacterium]
MIELLVVFAVTAAVVGLAGKLPDARKVKRIIATTHIQPIESLTDGAPAAIRGQVDVATSTTIGPVSGRACVCWVVEFDEVGMGGDYRELGRAAGGHPFMLRGEAATARIVPDEPRIAVPPVERKQLIGPFTGELGEIAKRVCRRMNYPQTSYLRATEYAVLPGMTLTVLGWCTLEPDPEAVGDVTGYRK